MAKVWDVMYANGQLSKTCIQDYYFGQVCWSNRRINKHNLNHCFFKVNFARSDMTHPAKLMCVENEVGYNRKRKRSGSDSSPASKRRRQKISVQKMQAKYIAKQAAKKRKLIALGFPVDSGEEEEAMRQDQEQKLSVKKSERATSSHVVGHDENGSNLEVVNVVSDKAAVVVANKADEKTGEGMIANVNPGTSNSKSSDISRTEADENPLQKTRQSSSDHPESISKNDQRVRAWVEKVEMDQSESDSDSPVIPARNSITPPSKPVSPSSPAPVQPCSSKTRVVVVNDDSNITKRESGVSSEMLLSDLPSDATMETIGNETQELLDYSLPSIPSGELHYDDDAQDGKFLQNRLRTFGLNSYYYFRSFSW